MATRDSGRNEDRSSARSAKNAASGPTASRNQSATSGSGTRQSAASSRGTSSERTADTNQQSRGTGSQSQGQDASARSDQQRDLQTSREQGATRPSSSAGGGDVRQQEIGYPTQMFAMGSPFAMMRRMMDDMDRIFSDFGFTHPGLLASSLFDPNAWGASQSSQRAIGGGQTSSGGARGALAPNRGQGVQRGGQRGLQPMLQNLWAPQVEIFERGNNLVVRADLPGLSRDDVNVEVDDDALVIRGERRNDLEEEQEGYYRTERSYGSFYRAIPLPDGVDANQANASFKEGVLEVTFPKPQQQSRAKKIDVK
jgi:HSP20 family protein